MSTFKAPQVGDLPPADATNATETTILSTPVYKSTPGRLRIFLEAYAKTGRVNRACEAAHITPKNALPETGM
jgi:hypothetical protein